MGARGEGCLRRAREWSIASKATVIAVLLLLIGATFVGDPLGVLGR